MSFAGNSILITGASGLIGRAYVDRFLELGFTVCAQVNTGELHARPNLHVIAEDLAVTKSGNSLVQEALARAGKLDYVINNAANQAILDPATAARAEIELMMRINVDAPKEIIDEAAKSGVQVVLNISSVEALNPRAGHEDVPLRNCEKLGCSHCSANFNHCLSLLAKKGIKSADQAETQAEGVLKILP
jgi:3-oxoacyl-[acyl-carrier protein] reductase